MKIIEHGPTIDEDWELECVCEKYNQYDSEGCGTKVIISETDIYKYLVYRGTDWEPDEYGYQYICPVCGKEVRIKDNLIPTRNKYHINSQYEKPENWKESDIIRKRISAEIREKWITERRERLKVKTLKIVGGQ